MVNAATSTGTFGGPVLEERRFAEVSYRRHDLERESKELLPKCHAEPGAGFRMFTRQDQRGAREDLPDRRHRDKMAGLGDNP